MSDRIIPNGSPDSHPISGLDDFQTHLRDLENDPSLPFNLKLLDDIELQLTGTSSPSQLTYNIVSLITNTSPLRIKHPPPPPNRPPPPHPPPQNNLPGPLPAPLPHHQAPLPPDIHPHPHHRRPALPPRGPRLPSPRREPPRPRHHPQGRQDAHRGRPPQHPPGRRRRPRHPVARQPRRRRRRARGQSPRRPPGDGLRSRPRSTITGKQPEQHQWLPSLSRRRSRRSEQAAHPRPRTPLAPDPP